MQMISLQSPFDEATIRALRAGDLVSLSGRIFTGRDRLHKHLAETGDSPVDLRNGALFHCGPVVQQTSRGDWTILAAGPTTSIREEPYMADVIAQQGVRVIIGKGGMGEKTLAACQTHGCVYLQAVGGAAAVIARCIQSVDAVHFLNEFGATEALWSLTVRDLPLVVGMDTQGRSLFADVAQRARQRLQKLLT